MTERAHTVAPVAKSIKCNDTVSGTAKDVLLGELARSAGGGSFLYYYII